MRTAQFVMAALLLLEAPGAGAGEIPFKGKVASVTVYTAGAARVIRSGEFSVPAGRSVLKTEPLPPKADIQSVQVKLIAGVKIEAVEPRRELAAAVAIKGEIAKHRQRLKEMEDKLFQIGQELRALDDSAQSQRETLKFLEQLRKQAAQTAGREMAVQKLAVETWEQALNLAEKRSITARTVIRELAAQRRQVQEKQEKESRQYHELRRKRPKEIYQTRVYVTVTADQPARGVMRLSYNVSGAHWQPSYRASADLQAKTVSLDITGSVWQSTGEDWDDVKLSFSTARPDIGTDVPTLLPWYIRTGARLRDQNAEAARRRGTPPQVAITGLTTLPGVPEPPPPPTDTLSAGVATVFTAKAAARIPSDGQPHKIPVATINSRIELEHVAIPKIMPHAFLRAAMANQAPFPLLPGVVEVMVGESYVGRGMMKLTAPGEKFKLSLGIDERVKISLRLLEDKLQRKRRGDRVATTNVFEIKAVNYGGEEVALTVLDQLPISKLSAVKVSFGSEAKRALRGAEFPGQLKWAFKLPPGKSERIVFAFTIEYPEHMRRQLQRFNKQVEYDIEQTIQGKRGQNAKGQYRNIRQRKQAGSGWQF